MDLDFFDNPTVKKGIAVMFWQFFQSCSGDFSDFEKLPDFWEMNPRTFGLLITKYASTQRAKNNCHQDYPQYLKSIPYPHHTRVKMAS